MLEPLPQEHQAKNAMQSMGKPIIINIPNQSPQCPTTANIINQKIANIIKKIFILYLYIKYNIKYSKKQLFFSKNKKRTNI